MDRKNRFTKNDNRFANPKSKKCIECGKIFWVKNANGKLLNKKFQVWRERQYCGRKCSNHSKFRLSEDAKVIISQANSDHYGANHGNWRGKRSTKLLKVIRGLSQYKKWKKAVLSNSEFHCKICLAEKNLVAHHIIPLNKLID